MKKWISVIVLIALICSAVAALADSPYSGSMPLYVNREKIKVYREQSTGSGAIVKLKGATSVTPELVSDDGAWIGILVEDTKHGGQVIGWVPADQLVDYLKEHTTVRVLYAKDELIAHKSPDYNLYYKYDSHWNTVAAFIGAQMIRRELTRAFSRTRTP